MARAEINGARLHYVEVGDGPPCLVLHGGPGLDHNYLRGLDALAEVHRLVYLDLRGHGGSDGAEPAAMTHAQFLADFEALREELQIRTWSVLGHSYGGFLALEYALARPRSVARLLLVDTGAAMDMPEKISERLRARPSADADAVAAFTGTGYTNDEEFRAWLLAIAPLYFHRFEPRFADDLFRAVRFDAHAGAMAGANVRGYNVTPHLGRVRQPALILHGRHDFIMPVEQALRLHAGIPGSTMEIFEASGHFPWLEEPQAFFAAARDWIRGVAS